MIINSLNPNQTPMDDLTDLEIMLLVAMIDERQELLKIFFDPKQEPELPGIKSKLLKRVYQRL